MLAAAALLAGDLLPPFEFDVLTELVGLRSVLRAALARQLGLPLGHPDVDDGEAEVLRRAVEGRARLRDGEPLRPWVLGIARHVAIDQRRRRSRLRPLDDEDEALVDPAPAPPALLERRDRARRVEQALAILPEKQREALLLFHAEGLEYRLIAERLGVPIGTVCTWIARARQAMARVLADDAPEGHRGERHG